ncbi:hypothetical protein GCM10007853_29080 [Algimonas ampicilliniresistens]|uniref:Uncharacterized protein n=1 Tax=Algimonas ampicilliniresistens TaxID=1298735 RepID=A0ABQ5VEE1_9PROT|nr:hypothetical protein GCM10007853_29080 [Algimonas ampicilliniresistens]
MGQKGAFDLPARKADLAHPAHGAAARIENKQPPIRNNPGHRANPARIGQGRARADQDNMQARTQIRDPVHAHALRDGPLK